MRKAAALTNPKAAHTKRSPAFGGTTDGEYEFVGRYPAGEASARLVDELNYQRAMQAYIWATPLVNSVAFKKALVDAGVSLARRAFGGESGTVRRLQLRG